jgi:hypothetical protein
MLAAWYGCSEKTFLAARVMSSLVRMPFLSFVSLPDAFVAMENYPSPDMRVIDYLLLTAIITSIYIYRDR